MPEGPPDWRGFDEQVIPDGWRHYQQNEYAKNWNAFRCSRSMTGVVNTWIWRKFGFNRTAWLSVSLILHLLNAWIIYLLLITIGMKPAYTLVCPLIFLLHPIQIPAILQTAARAGVQSATFAYSALLCLALGFWPVALLAQFLSVKSKEDGWIYLIFWPVILYFKGT